MEIGILDKSFICVIQPVIKALFGNAELNRFNEQNPVSYDKRTYTVDEIQDILGISRPTAYNLVKQGVFHSVRVGGHIRISKKSFDDWLYHTDE